MAISEVWQHDWIVHPGEILEEALEERAMSQSELARRMDRPVKTINEIIRGKAALTPDTAIQLERTLGVSASFWNGIETRYREQLARVKAHEELEAEVAWLDGFPLKELRRHGLISHEDSSPGLVNSLLHFFGVASPHAWERQWLEPVAAFRESPTFEQNPKAVSSWLQWGRLEAEKLKPDTYSKEGFTSLLRKIQSLTALEPVGLVLDQVRTECSRVGVAVVMVPELEGTHLSGATHWLSAKSAVLQLSLRHKTDDQLWFTFFHEAAHILEGPKLGIHVDTVDSSQDDGPEARADSFARTSLISDQQWEDFVQGGSFAAPEIKRFAKRMSVSPGVVVGRLQREAIISYSQLNHLKRKVDWAV